MPVRLLLIVLLLMFLMLLLLLMRLILWLILVPLLPMLLLLLRDIKGYRKCFPRIPVDLAIAVALASFLPLLSYNSFRAPDAYI